MKPVWLWVWARPAFLIVAGLAVAVHPSLLTDRILEHPRGAVGGDGDLRHPSRAVDECWQSKAVEEALRGRGANQVDSLLPVSLGGTPLDGESTLEWADTEGGFLLRWNESDTKVTLSPA